MTVETTLGEKYPPVARRIKQVANALTSQYNYNIPRDDIAQEMWLALIGRIEDPTFTGQPVNHIVNALAWKARDYARKEFRYMNGLPEAGLSSEPFDTEWQYIAAAISPRDDIGDVDDQLTAIATIDALMLALANRPRTLSIARSLLNGRNKVETASHVGLDPSTITYHIRVMRGIVAEMVA